MKTLKNRAAMFGRGALAVVLVTVLAFPLAACQSGPSSQSSSDGDAQSKAADSDERWANFDDGSDVLSLSVPYFSSNANELNFNVVLDKGTLAAELPEGAVGLGGALDGWQVQSATRSDDVTVAVTAVRPAGQGNGASIASVTLASKAVVLPGAEEAKSASSSSASESAEEKIPSADEINKQKGVEWPQDAEIVNKTIETDDPKTGETITDTPEASEKLIDAINAGEVKSAEDVDKFVSNEGTAASTAEEKPAADAASEATNEQELPPYEVKAMFVNPALSVDFEHSKIEKDKMTLTLVASDFKFNADLGANSFELRNADGCAVAEAHRVSDQEAEAELSLPEGGAAKLNGATLVLKAGANESEAEVPCSIEVPAPWLEIKFDHADDQANTVSYVVELNNSNSEVAPEDLTVKINDEQVNNGQASDEQANNEPANNEQANDEQNTDVKIEHRDDGTNEVTINADAVPEGATVSVEAPAVEDVAGNKVEAEPAAEMAEGTEDNEDNRDFAVEVAKNIGIGALKAAVSYTWKQTCNNALDPHNSKGLYQASAADVLREVTAVQSRLVDLSAQIGALSNTVQVGFDGSIINKAKSLTSRMKTREVLLANSMKKIAAEQDDDKRAELIKTVAKEKQSILEAMTTDMGELYDLIMEADPASGRTLLDVYDQMMARSYNWGAQTYNNRLSFRDNLAKVWASALYDIRLLYGVADPEGNADYLDRLDEQSKNVEKILAGEGSELKPDCYVQEIGGKKCYYNHTTGKWYYSLAASETAAKWSEGMGSVMEGKRTQYTASSPFRRWNYRTPAFSWESVYLGTEEAQKMISKLHNGQTLKQELEGVGLATKANLVTCDEYDSTENVFPPYIANDWLADTVDVANATAENPSVKKARDGKNKAQNKIYDGWIFPTIFATAKHENWKTNLDTMFVLKKADVKKQPASDAAAADSK